jgi:hypothetical protein
MRRVQGDAAGGFEFILSAGGTPPESKDIAMDVGER